MQLLTFCYPPENSINPNVSITFDLANTLGKMDKQTPKPDPDSQTLEMFSESLKNRNRALRKILKQLQKNSDNNTSSDNEAGLLNTESDIHKA